MKAIVNGRVITENAVLTKKAIIYEEKIIDIIDEDKVDNYKVSEIIDAKGQYISPGFIDIHIHGSGGCDTMDGSIKALQVISRAIARYGVTGFLPTTMTMDKEHIYGAFEVIRALMNIKMEGASVLGCHMEGPFINEKYKGAQNPEYIIKPDFNFIKDYLDIIKIITIAPEKDKDQSFIKNMKNYKEVVISMGHTNATYEEAIKSIEMGVSHAAHIFNAMSPLNHREPGVVGAVFKTNITCEIIADTIHVHPGIFDMLKAIKGMDRLILITDAMRAGCMKEGIYDLGGQEVVVKDNSARLRSGALAGSVLTLNNAVKNMYEHSTLEIFEAVKMASLNPAKVIGIDKHKGSLAIGKDSDIIIFNKDFQVLKTIVSGETLNIH